MLYNQDNDDRDNELNIMVVIMMTDNCFPVMTLVIVKIMNGNKDSDDNCCILPFDVVSKDDNEESDDCQPIMTLTLQEWRSVVRLFS